MSPDTREALAFCLALLDEDFLAEAPTEPRPPADWDGDERSWMDKGRSRKGKEGGGKDGQTR